MWLWKPIVCWVNKNTFVECGEGEGGSGRQVVDNRPKTKSINTGSDMKSEKVNKSTGHHLIVILSTVLRLCLTYLCSFYHLIPLLKAELFSFPLPQLFSLCLFCWAETIFMVFYFLGFVLTQVGFQITLLGVMCVIILIFWLWFFIRTAGQSCY